MPSLRLVMAPPRRISSWVRFLSKYLSLMAVLSSTDTIRSFHPTRRNIRSKHIGSTNDSTRRRRPSAYRASPLSGREPHPLASRVTQDGYSPSGASLTVKQRHLLG